MVNELDKIRTKLICLVRLCKPHLYNQRIDCIHLGGKYVCIAR